MSEYTIAHVAAQTVLSTIQTSTLADFKELFGVWLPKVHQYATSIGAPISGPPFARYHQFDADGVVLELGIPISGDVIAEGEITQREIPAAKVLVITHVGPYDELNKAWSALAHYMKENKYKFIDPCWESYLSDPASEPDPNKWVTKLYQPME